MEIVSIKYSKTIQTAQYEPETLEVQANLTEGEGFDETVQEIKEKVYAALGRPLDKANGPTARVSKPVEEVKEEVEPVKEEEEKKVTKKKVTKKKVTKKKATPKPV